MNEIVEFCIIRNILKFKQINEESIYSNIIGLSKINNIEAINRELLKKEILRVKEFSQQQLQDRFNILNNKIIQPIKTNNTFKKEPELISQNNIFRFAPNPNFEPTIANLRGFYINHKLSLLYPNSKLILRFDDTNPDKCIYSKSTYLSYINAAKWLEIKVDEVLYASKRLNLYYAKIKELITNNEAYINTSKKKNFIIKHKIFNFNKLFSKKGWTILDNKNIVLFRQLQTKPFLWPTLRFQGCIDDILTKTTCIVRGKDLMSLENDQIKFCKIFNTKLPKFIYWGRNKINDLNISSSYMFNLVKRNRKSAIDLNLASFSSLVYYEISPIALKKWFDEIGVTQNDTTLNLEILKALNKKSFNKKIYVYNVEIPIIKLWISKQHITNNQFFLHVDKKFRNFVNSNSGLIFCFNLYNSGVYKINKRKVIKLLL